MVILEGWVYHVIEEKIYIVEVLCEFDSPWGAFWCVPQ